jgi:hypothetical protein
VRQCPFVSAFVFGLLALQSPNLSAQTFEADIQPLLVKFCVKCHGKGEELSGEVDFTKSNNDATAISQYEIFEAAAELLRKRQMPPEGEEQPTDQDRKQFFAWYQHRLVDSVKAHPGVFKPRRLSATEYRNTLRSLFGFDLEVAVIAAEQTVSEKSMVMKLLPTDPPGGSGFRNDTDSNPLSTVIWDQYSVLVDLALEELFSAKRRKRLEALAGPLPQSGMTTSAVETLIRNFLPRAYRRTVPEPEIAAILARLNEGEDLVALLKVELKAALMSPRFLYRGLMMKRTPGTQQPVDDFELAERLSYFLWADMPDEELFTLAASGKLSEPEIYAEQIERLLDSPKSRNLAEDFAVQWFSLDEIDHVSNNPPHTIALKSQPVDYLNWLFAEDRPLLELIDSRTTFANPHTAKYYGRDRGQMKPYRKQKGIEIEAVPNQKLTLKNTKERGGLLTMPGVLAMNRGPVLRGTWMLERILGEHLPDPPPDVGQVQPNRSGENLSFRERFELHRSKPTCAVCHDKIDPLGFSLEEYGSDGTYNGKKSRVDTSGQLPSGEKFEDYDGLKKILMTTQRQRVIQNIVERTLSYALCRKLKLHDRPTVMRIVKKLDSTNGTWRDLVHSVCDSLPFRETFVRARTKATVAADSKSAR